MSDYIKREDTIYRQAAINAIRASTSKYTGFMEMEMYTDDDAVEAINGVSSAQQWIPCSERLPEEYVDVLVWFEYYRFGEYNRMYSTYGIGDYDAEYDKWWINHESGWRGLHVFAWMPLPEPYKGEES